MPAGPTPLNVRQVPLERLHAAPWNANVVPARTLVKIRRSIVDFGIVENLVARPAPEHGDGHLEVLSGNHRLEIYGELELAKAPVHVVELDDIHARLLAETLNNTRGDHDPEKYADLLRTVLEQMSVQQVVGYLPETEHSIDKIIGEQIRADANFATMPRPGKTKSKVGEVYELGPHRIMCGDSCNPEHVDLLLDGEEPILLLTDPPYGVNLDMSWRRGAQRRKGGQTRTKAPAKYAKSTGIMNDHRVDWSEAFALVPSLKVAYVWHASSVGHRVAAGLESIGFSIVQQIFWDKGGFVLGRGQYQFKHEAALYAAVVGAEVPWYGTRSVPALYARKKGSGAPWLGGHDQTTVWEAPSPKLRRTNAAAEDQGVDHPTQKPVEVYTRPIKNHLELGEAFYDAFAGSGTAVIAAEITGRRCYTMELDPKFVDLVRQRYADYTGRDELSP